MTGADGEGGRGARWLRAAVARVRPTGARGTVAFAFAAAALLVWIFWGVLGPDRTFGDLHDDISRYFAPHYAFVRDALLGGRLPLWNPHVLTGQPELASGQSGVLYPPLLLLLPSLGVARFVEVGLVLHLWLLAVAAYVLGAAWLRARGEPPAAAALTGLGVALSGFVLGRLVAGHVSIVFALPWFVFALAAGVGVVARGSRWSGAGLAVSAALAVLAGGMQLAPLVAPVALVVWATVPPAGPGRVAAGRLALWGAVGVALAAVQLVPSLELAALAARAHQPLAGVAAGFGLQPSHLPGLLLPGWTRTVQPHLPFEFDAAVGAPLVALAAVPVLVGPHRRAAAALWLATAALLLLGSAVAAPLLTAVPGFRLLRVPARFVIAPTVILPLLAAVGLTLAARDRRARTAAALSLVVAMAILVALSAWEDTRWALPTLLATAAAGVALATRLPAGRAAVLVGVLAVVPLVVGGSVTTEGRSGAVEAGEGERPATARERAPGGGRRLIGEDDRWNFGMVAGWRNLGGYEPAITWRAALLAKAIMSGVPAGPWRDLHLMWPLGDAPARPDLAARFGVLGPPGARLTAGRVALVRCAVAAAGPVEALALALTLPDDAVAVEGEASPSPCTPGVAGTAGTVRVEVDDPERLLATVRADTEATLFIADLPYPGWEATVDGHPTPILPADGAGRAIAVSPGEHRVELRYRPGSLLIGAAVSAFGLLTLVALLAAPALRRRPAHPRIDPPQPER